MFGRDNSIGHQDDMNHDNVQEISDFIGENIPVKRVKPKKAKTTHQSYRPNNLVDLKMEVLGQLAPLVSHLDQSPEEKFRTTMMLIQSSDNADLLIDAYDAALSINNPKTKANALLEIVQEINYFTQKTRP